MKVTILDVFGSDRQVADAARTTIKMEDGHKLVTDAYMRKMYLCEHSPIRIKQFLILVEDIPYWIVMHFTRHKFGIEHWVSSQRDDRTGVPRENLSQDALVNWKFLVNAAEVVAISRKRRCTQAHKDTRNAWSAILAKLEEVDWALVQACVPDCIYRGWCYEYKSCNYHKTEHYTETLDKYREEVNGWDSQAQQLGMFTETK